MGLGQFCPVVPTSLRISRWRQRSIKPSMEPPFWEEVWLHKVPPHEISPGWDVWWDRTPPSGLGFLTLGQLGSHSDLPEGEREHQVIPYAMSLHQSSHNYVANFKRWGMLRSYKWTRDRNIHGMCITAARLVQACSGMWDLNARPCGN